MFPLSLLAANKLMGLLVTNDSLSKAISANASLAGVDVPALSSSQVMVSAISPDIGDRDLQLSYPRVCIYASQVRNQQREKFRSFSGEVAVTADIWSSASLENPVEQALHFYVDGVTAILRANIGDWQGGFRYSGIYDVQIQSPKTGGFGFVQLARVNCTLDLSLN